jgi:hypothetical protein
VANRSLPARNYFAALLLIIAVLSIYLRRDRD